MNRTLRKIFNGQPKSKIMKKFFLFKKLNSIRFPTNIDEFSSNNSLRSNMTTKICDKEDHVVVIDYLLTISIDNLRDMHWKRTREKLYASKKKTSDKKRNTSLKIDDLLVFDQLPNKISRQTKTIDIGNIRFIRWTNQS